MLWLVRREERGDHTGVQTLSFIGLNRSHLDKVTLGQPASQPASQPAWPHLSQPLIIWRVFSAIIKLIRNIICRAELSSRSVVIISGREIDGTKQRKGREGSLLITGTVNLQPGQAACEYFMLITRRGIIYLVIDRPGHWSALPSPLLHTNTINPHPEY